MGDHHQLEVGKFAYELTLDLYRDTARFPREELYGITQQIRRGAGSIGANIAEGCGRKNDGGLRRFAQIARGSAEELKYLLALAKDLGFLSNERHGEHHDRIERISRMLNSLIE